MDHFAGRRSSYQHLYRFFLITFSQLSCCSCAFSNVEQGEACRLQMINQDYQTATVQIATRYATWQNQQHRSKSSCNEPAVTLESMMAPLHPKMLGILKYSRSIRNHD